MSVNIIGFFFSRVRYLQSAAFRLMKMKVFCQNFFGLRRIKHWKIRIAYRQWHSNFPRRGRKRKTGNYVFSGFGNGISRGWEQKSTTEIFATGRFWLCTWKTFFVGKDQFNNWQFCILKIRLIVCFCRDSTYVFILSAPTHYLIFMRGLSILLFSSIMESTFLVSKGLLSLYDKENNAWLLVDAYFSSRVQLDISLAHCEMSKAGQNYSMLIGWDRGHCFLITRALLVIDSGNFRKTLQIREKAILNCPRALRLHIQSKSWYHERLTQKAKAKWKVSDFDQVEF